MLSISLATTGRSAAIAARICWNNLRGTITSAIWNAIDPGADLEQPFAQGGQGPVLDLIRQRQRAQEVGEVVGQRVQLQPHNTGGETAGRTGAST